MRKRSYKLDMCLFDLGGIRFGWSSVIGIVPAFGDAADALMALLLVWRCTKIECGLGSTALLTMLINVAIDFVIGIVPFIGDIADAAFKANTRNVRVLEKRLDEVYKPKGLQTKDREMKKKLKEERRKSGLRYDAEYEDQPATVVEEFSDDEAEDRRRFVEQGRAEDRRQAQNTATTTNQVNRPANAAVNTNEPRRGGWFNGLRSGTGQPDVEKAQGIPPQQPPRGTAST